MWSFALVGLAIVLFSIAANLPWQLEEYSQDRQSLASFQVVELHRWWYQEAPRTRREERDATKPPLVPWISAGIYAITKSWNVALRLPSAVSVVCLIVLLTAAAKRAFGWDASLIALVAFGFNLLTPRLATLARTDMPLALATFAIGLTIWYKTRSGKGWTLSERWTMCLALTVGLYIKGPILLVFTLPGLLFYRWLRRPENGLGRSLGWWPWLVALAIFLVWVAGGIISQPGFYQQVVVHEFAGRFSSAEQAPHPAYFYVAHLLQKFAPWSELLIIFALLLARASEFPLGRQFRSLSPDTLWLVCWSITGLIIMSAVPSKRIDRIFPIIPPLCLLLAAQYAAGRGTLRLKRSFSRWISVAVALSICFTGFHVFYERMYLGYRNGRDALVRFGEEIVRRASVNHWRYESLPAHDGALLVYLHKPQFVESARAIEMWNAGHLDALVVESIDLPTILPQLHDATVSDMSATERIDEKGRHYVLIVRRGIPSEPNDEDGSKPI